MPADRKGRMINSSLRNYGLLLNFIGVLACAIAVLGGVFVAGLVVAEGAWSLSHLFLLRDGLCLLVLGVMALRSGGPIGRYSRPALVRWEWCSWVVTYAALLLTLGAVIVVEVGPEYLVPPVFYFLNSISATRKRRGNEGYFEYLRQEDGNPGK